MHGWFLTACLLGFCSRIKMFEKFGKFALTSVLGLWLHCGTVGLLETEENLGIYEFSLLSPTSYDGGKSAQCIQLRLRSSSGLCGLWGPLIFSHCSFPSSHNKCWCSCWPSLQKDWGTQSCAHQNIHTESSMLQKNIFCLAVRFVLKALLKCSVDYFSYTAIYSWDLAGSAITLHFFLLGKKK